ncbi:hypothetical protein [Planomicrobium sp. MB-3u-38]|uniref:hypothetical protein n=1 Tax=Planomicrobium sp. MB-3u-38 TaxID=2058318 RepID=UPI000C7CAF45|nr:hypothetical protein [Planomicrobium sp. MB-3u-38]PKH12121.1 hypothetical protein CXF70_01050 [Planomicrobium sp. MB-3u-38]
MKKQLLSIIAIAAIVSSGIFYFYMNSGESDSQKALDSFYTHHNPTNAGSQEFSLKKFERVDDTAS